MLLLQFSEHYEVRDSCAHYLRGLTKLKVICSWATIVANTYIAFVRVALIICCMILWQLISLNLSLPIRKMEDNTSFYKVAM